MEILRNLFRRGEGIFQSRLQSTPSPVKLEIQTRRENTFEEIARQIDTDRTNYPVLWAPNGDGGEFEGSYIEFHLDRTLKVPYQVVPFFYLYLS